MKILALSILGLFYLSSFHEKDKIGTNYFFSGIISQYALKDSCFYWETLNNDQKEEILQSKDISKIAMDFYHGKFKPGDNENTFNLLGIITSGKESKDVHAFYFFLFNKLCNISDAALSEILGSYCQRVILSSPVYVLDYFKNNDKTLKMYASFIGYELYFKEVGTSEIEYGFSEFRKILSDKLKSKKNYDALLKRFYKEIEMNMKRMD